MSELGNEIQGTCVITLTYIFMYVFMTKQYLENHIIICYGLVDMKLRISKYEIVSGSLTKHLFTITDFCEFTLHNDNNNTVTVRALLLDRSTIEYIHHN